MKRVQVVSKMATTNTQAKLPTRTLRKIAALADVDPRTVARVVAGLPTQPSQRERIHEALKGAGLWPLTAEGSRS
jgi:hypothetical protein